jgi:hypothetical protein
MITKVSIATIAFFLFPIQLFAGIGYNIINIKDYPTTDSGIQQALSAASNSTIYFPKGTYVVHGTLHLPGSIKLIGDAKIGDNYSTLVRMENSNSPLMDLSQNWSKIEIYNIAFIGNNILDLRNTIHHQPSTATIVDCNFSSTSTGIVAINIVDHDFTLIQNCNFRNFAHGFCAIRIAGWMDSVNSNCKNSTQVKIRDCVFGPSRIGISCELVDAIVLEGNDFSGPQACIDIGGNRYFRYRPNDNVFNKAGGVPILPYGTLFNGSGWFSNVNIRDNHFENFDTGTVVDGMAGKSYSKMQNHGVRIESNNFQSPNAGAIMISCKGAVSLTTFCNELRYDNIKNITGIQYSACVNPRFILDNFSNKVPYSKNNLAAQTCKDYESIGTNYSPFIWKTNADKRLGTMEQSAVQMDGRLDITGTVSIPEIQGSTKIYGQLDVSNTISLNDSLLVNGKKVIGARKAAIPDLSDSGSYADSASRSKINQILEVLRSHGLIDP